ncbi:MAG: exodeoxyribonuclease V subunit gamma [Chlamydiae bacterium]|nr:exodeoxyribonuclease V subunit gamma [Chlamydiota bacterium]
MLYCIFSNRVEILAEALKKALWGSSADPLEERLIILPSQAMKRFLMMNLVDDYSVAMGLQFPYLDKAIKALVPLSFPSKNTLSFLIEKEIEKRLEERNLQELLQEMHISKKTLHETGVRKALAGFSDTLADLFLLYGLYAGQMVDEWLKRGSVDWQSAIFCAIYQNPKVGFPYKALSLLKKKSLSLHIFCPSFVPKVWLEFFSFFNARIYALSSTAHAGFDHPLLAAWGRGEKEFVISLEQLEVSQARVYQGPEVLLQEDFLTEDVFPVNEKPSFLKGLQTDLLLQGDTVSWPLPDDSLSIHSYDSKFREVEGLYQRIAVLIEKNHISLKDIVIMAPQISEYLPYIDAVFNHKASSMPVQFFDTKGPSGSLVVQGFLDLVALSENRCDLDSVEKLLSNPSLGSGLTAREIVNFSKLMKEIGIKWGLDIEDRQRWFYKNYGSTESFNPSKEGTWEECFERLFMHALENTSSRFWYDLPLIEKSYHFYAKLRDFLRIVRGDLEKTLTEWGYFLLEMAIVYWPESAILEGCLSELINSQETFTISFTSLYPRLINILRSESEAYGDQNKLDAISACSLLPMRAVPSSIICLLGLSLEKFPRRQAPIALDKRLGRKDLDYAPTKAEFDRMLFLETLLSTREHLLISYTTTGDDTQESLVISELREYAPVTVNVEPVKHLSFKSNLEAPLSILKTERKKEDVSLYLLSQALENPLKLFYQRSMGIYLPRSKIEQKSFLTNYEKFFVEQKALKITQEQLLQDLIKKGYMPPSPLSAVIREQISNIYKGIEESLQHFNIERSHIQTIHFIKGLEKPFEEGRHLFYPAICVKERFLEGKVRAVSNKKIISLKEKSLEAMASEWPFWMAISLDLILLKEKEIISRKAPDAWEALLAYYDYCTSYPVPLFPSILRALLKGEEIIQTSFDPYYKLFLTSGEKGSFQEVLPFLKEIYGQGALCL